MISFLRGTVADKTLSSAVIEVAGVGYLCGISASTAAALPAPGSGQACLVHTYLQVREDGLALFGFATTEERAVFERLVAVNGVGPKLALAVLSSFSPEMLREIVAAGDEKRLATVPGIGKKTASRLILELKDALKVGIFDAGATLEGLGGSPAAAAGSLDEAKAALMSMGFTDAECALALKGYDGPASDVSSVIRFALKRLGSA